MAQSQGSGPINFMTQSQAASGGGMEPPRSPGIDVVDQLPGRRRPERAGQVKAVIAAANSAGRSSGVK